MGASCLEVEEIVYLSFACASLSFTVTEAKLFEPLREWAKEKKGCLGELTFRNSFFTLAVALLLFVVYRPCLFDKGWVLDFFTAAFAIVLLSIFQWFLMCRLIEKAGK